MIQIRRFSFLLLTVSLITLGLIGGFFACSYTMGNSDPAGSSSQTAMVWVSKENYDGLVDLASRYSKAEALREYISDTYYTEVDQDQLLEGIYYGLFAALEDPYSQYLSEEQFENMMINATGDYSGIGITMSPTDDYAHVYAAGVTEGAPAEEAGVRVNDLILKVDGVAYTGDELSECASHARGEAGTKVVLTLQRGDQVFDVELTRRRIQANTVKSELLEDGIGYIQITSFEDPTYSDFKKALTGLEDSGAIGFVLDIRNNGGGVVTSAIKVADELLDKATVVYTEDHDGNREYYTTKDGKTSLPFVLLVNGNSASASEILAAGIQDNAAAPLVGTTTYGKGIVQSIKQLSDGSAIKITTSAYFTPSGQNIHGVGIEPDIELEYDYETAEQTGDDNQVNKAIEILEQKIAAE
ncbi:MAG: S41 family peptidase [Firmicutes bacterium]|nr:S41 family peptidase [Bacillota bacterium]